MADFSIKALTAPFIPIAHRCFDKATRYVISKYPSANPIEVKHDLQVLTFNTASLITISAVGLAYYKMISLVAAFAFSAFFYFMRCLIHETLAPLPPATAGQSKLLNEITAITSKLIHQEQKPATKTIGEKIKSTFHQGDDIVISGIVILKLTHQPLPRMIHMIFTRT